MADFTKRRNEQILDAMSPDELYAKAREVAPQAMAQADGWTANLELMPEPLARQVRAQVTLVLTLLDMAQSSNPDFSGPGRRGLAKLIIAEGKSPDPAEHPWVASLMEDARELMHGGPELATVREEVRVEEARQRMRGPTDAQR